MTSKPDPEPAQPEPAQPETTQPEPADADPTELEESGAAIDEAKAAAGRVARDETIETDPASS